MAPKKRGKRPAAKRAATRIPTEFDESKEGEHGELDLAPKLPSTPSKGDFLTAFGLLEEDFEQAGVAWEDLRAISENHLREYPELENTAEYIATRLRRHPAVHTVMARVKDPAHLMEKVLRKLRQSPRRKINLRNYREEFTDLIGIRVLHLFKGDWLPIHSFITGSWELAEDPIAYLRRGDPSEVEEIFREHGCDIQEHEFGYRSVHYLINSRPAKVNRVAELQVRTIFEEGWSEIDHRIRYPYKLDNEVLNQFLGVFNHLAGSADEMGTFIQRLRDQLDVWESGHRALSAEVAKLKIDASKKRELELQIKDLEGRLPKATIGGIGPHYFGTSAIVGASGVLSSKPSIAASIEGLLSSNLTVNQRKCTQCGKELPLGTLGALSLCGKCMQGGLNIG